MSTHPIAPHPVAPHPVALRARGVRVVYGPRPVLDDVDLDVRRHEVLALVGPNGAGKSTLLGVLAGDLAPDDGEVDLDGQPLGEWRLRALARQRAVLTQEHRVSFPFPAVDVVRMGRSPWRGRPEEDQDERVVAEAMAATDLDRLAGQPFGLLSGGEKGRTAFARLLAQQTRILILDEPTAALDIGHQEAVLDRARREAATGAAVVIVLHDLTLAAAWADRVALLHHGRLAAEGPPADVLTTPMLSLVYDYPIDVTPHPTTGELLVLPDRQADRQTRASREETA